jgi:PKD repeat protein
MSPCARTTCSRLHRTVAVVLVVLLAVGQPADARGFFGKVFGAPFRLLNKVDRGLNNATRWVNRKVVNKVVPRPLRPAARQFVAMKIHATGYALTGLNRYGRQVNKLRGYYNKAKGHADRVQRFRRKVGEVRQKAHGFADRIREEGREAQQRVTRAAVKAYMDGLITKEQARDAIFEGARLTEYGERLAGRVDDMARKITPENVAKGTARGLPRAWRAMTRKKPRAPSDQPRRERSGPVKVLQDAAKDAADAAGDEILREIDRNLRAEAREHLPRYALKKIAAEVWKRKLSPEAREKIDKMHRMGTGALELAEKGVSLPVYKKLEEGDIEGALAAAGKGPDVSDPSATDAAKDLLKGAYGRTRKDIGEKIRRAIRDRMRQRFHEAAGRVGLTPDEADRIADEAQEFRDKVRGKFPPPKAVISVNPTEGTVPLKVTCLATGSTGEGLSYSWTIGGRAVGGAKVTRTFDKPGTYTVSLTVTDKKGRTSTAGLEVKAKKPEPIRVAVGDVTASPSKTAPGERVTISVPVTITGVGQESKVRASVQVKIGGKTVGGDSFPANSMPSPYQLQYPVPAAAPTGKQSVSAIVRVNAPNPKLHASGGKLMDAGYAAFLVELPFHGTLSGSWSGTNKYTDEDGRTHSSPVSGTFTFTVSTNGTVTGRYEGDWVAGGISGRVTGDGKMRAGGGAAGEYAWQGTIRATPNPSNPDQFTLSGSGTWSGGSEWGRASGRWSSQ